ncbi:hypothetical protein DL239_08215 [Sedimentitalea sp. CY04]|uniref:Leishmanolysin n=1 Tax=Parasedimentitalea denitrificans TaxID=2211118 RepID=A0ABX0W8J9_9RHOB|nr:leishmanolysin-related zinc metalloendopeptidase [Sedimentitalea sp. CY04]NIZ60957.1 hypothetical protein [Sedimentitalea sp. CY04]
MQISTFFPGDLGLQSLKDLNSVSSAEPDPQLDNAEHFVFSQQEDAPHPATNQPHNNAYLDATLQSDVSALSDDLIFALSNGNRTGQQTETLPDNWANAKPEGVGGGNGNGNGNNGGGDGDGDTGVLDRYVSGGSAKKSFNVEVEFSGTWTADLQGAFIEAADYLSSIILGDITDIRRGPYATDDITISAALIEIDGPGIILGQAGPTVYRTANYLPAAGIMEFDIADAATFASQGQWTAIVLHEMMHTLGFGTMWDLMGLTSGSVSGGDMRFTGALATSYYNTELIAEAASDNGSANGVPIETDGSPGTAGGHWDEDLFNNEIMTGYIDNPNYMSNMTIAALEDMGYDTVIDDPNAPNDAFGPIPADTLLDLFA